MNQSVTYRQNAAECYEAARILSDPRQKAKLLAMAQSWISLADLAERNSHLDRIYETTAREPYPLAELEAGTTRRRYCFAQAARASNAVWETPQCLPGPLAAIKKYALEHLSFDRLL